MLLDGRPWQPAGPPPDLQADVAAAPGIHRHLDRVDALLRTRLTAVADLWAEPAGRVEGDSGRAGMPAVIDLPAMLAELIGTGGKRLRPILAFLGFRACGGGSAAADDLIRLSAALELLHSFALVHDDVMDESTSRRGRPTAHVGMARRHRELGGAGRSDRFGESMAVLLGDLAHAEADGLIADCSADLRRRWHSMIVELINGQVRDLAGAAGRNRDPRQALLVAQLKSGAYSIQRPLELGAVAAGADQGRLAVLSEYGAEIGTAFALRDDVLGIWGDPDVTGKPNGDDLLAGKPTVIIALAHQRLPAQGRSLLARIGTPDLDIGDIAALQRMIDDCGVRAEVETMIDRHVTHAVAALQDLGDTDSDTARLMIRLAHQVAWRDR